MQYRYQLGTVTLVNIEELNAAVAAAAATVNELWMTAYILAACPGISVQEFQRITQFANAAGTIVDSSDLQRFTKTQIETVKAGLDEAIMGRE
jgi:hypothetical protein